MEPVRMIKGGRLRYVYRQQCALWGKAFMYAPFKRATQYAATPEIAGDNLVRRMEREGWKRI